jgi:hypothetical protein
VTFLSSWVSSIRGFANTGSARCAVLIRQVKSQKTPQSFFKGKNQSPAGLSRQGIDF